ncbi:hypothetical protein [Kitasatospora sp. NPDC094011]|uniref:hypothetical protein n=1 Tax=Kitasatospora sp. NPDC094011 TaxID=3364090 RepID=UPI003800BCF4
MRTRLLAASLTALAAVSLAACSSSGSTSASDSNKATVAAATPSGATTASGSDAPATPAPPASVPATPDAPGTPGTPGTPEAPGSAPAKPAPPADAGLPAKPDADLTGKTVAALNAIDPAIVGGKPDQVVDQARKQCQAMYQFPKDKAKLAELAKQNFTSSEHPQSLDPDTVAKIDDALRATLCPPPH